MNAVGKEYGLRLRLLYMGRLERRSGRIIVVEPRAKRRAGERQHVSGTNSSLMVPNADVVELFGTVTITQLFSNNA